MTTPPISETAWELLDLIDSINKRERKPASRYVLEHMMEYGSEDYDVTALQDLLGPRPRRTALFMHLGDLYDYWRIRMTPGGYEVIRHD